VSADDATVDVEGHELRLTSLSKVYYPTIGFTKGEVIDYYRRVAPVLLPHLVGRPLTLKRYPDGVDEPFFYEKHAPRGRPEWVRTAVVTIGDGKSVEYVLAHDLATLLWVANLGSIELHAPMWRHPKVSRPDQIVFDLDPGAPATIVECCVVACRLRDILQQVGLTPVVKVSGKKGLHVLAGVKGVSSDEATELAQQVARRLEADDPDLVVSRMTKKLRVGKVLVDWSQNRAAKTTVAVYSLRATPEPQVSAPVTWEEVGSCEQPEDLVFGPDDVLARIDAHGDGFASLGDERARPRRLPG
jgi:bifunctional non-homologous end joining protein LigD